MVRLNMFISFRVNLIRVFGIKWILKICVSFAVKYRCTTTSEE